MKRKKNGRFARSKRKDFGSFEVGNEKIFGVLDVFYIFVVLSKAPYEIGGQPWVKAPPGDGFSTDYSPPPNRGYLVTN